MCIRDRDWFIQQTGRNGFTVEVGKGENPLPVEDFLPVYQKVKPLLWVGDVYKRQAMTNV